VQLWDLAARPAPVPRELVGHKRDVRALAWSPDGSTLASTSGDHTVRLWRGGDVQVLTGHSNAVNSVAWAPDGLRLASTSADHTARVWDVPTGAGRPVPHDAAVGRVVFLADGVHAVSWSLHEVQIWTDDLPYDTPGLLAWIDGHADATAGTED
jgi:WD40 repeat protein